MLTCVALDNLGIFWLQMYHGIKRFKSQTSSNILHFSSLKQDKVVKLNQKSYSVADLHS